MHQLKHTICSKLAAEDEHNVDAVIVPTNAAYCMPVDTNRDETYCSMEATLMEEDDSVDTNSTALRDNKSPYQLLLNDDSEATDDGGNAMLSWGFDHGDDDYMPQPTYKKEATKSLQAFREYVAKAKRNFIPFTAEEKNAVKLMYTLWKKKATLDTYDSVMEWHLRATGAIQDHESAFSKGSDAVSRDVLMKKLLLRYNMNPKWFNMTTINLPSSGARVPIVMHDAREMVVSLLTDPRLRDEDHLHFDNDPLAPPPDEMLYVADINTGTSYTMTYDMLIGGATNKMLVPIILYIDGAVTGQFDKLPIEALKMTLGIFNRKTRDEEHAWRTLGYVPTVQKAGSRGRRLFADSNHIGASRLNVEEGEGEDGLVDPADKSQDLHAILEVILQSYKQMEQDGMVWDYVYNGKTYHDLELVFYIPFVKCDGEEADKLCGKYLTRTGNVAQLCRYCQCPTAKTDDQTLHFPYKTEHMLKRYRKLGWADRLKGMSQQNIDNAFHNLRFGLQNRRGIHGACPMELLHAILLGMFMYIRNCFFGQIGKSSMAARDINGIAQQYGRMFAHQSDRDLPKTTFGKGIQAGKIMAKEFSGVMLLIATILQSTMGRRILQTSRSRGFREDFLLADWVLLLETMLQWEAYLKLGKMKVRHVRRLERKHRSIMYVIKKVLSRSEGMGMKIMKFHGILHIAQDILMFGVPMNFDTGSNESHHKLTKIAAKLTQKDIRVFEKQTARRIVEILLLELAMQEVTGRALWEYFDAAKEGIDELCTIMDIDKEGPHPITMEAGTDEGVKDTK